MYNAKITGVMAETKGHRISSKPRNMNLDPHKTVNFLKFMKMYTPKRFLVITGQYTLGIIIRGPLAYDYHD